MCHTFFLIGIRRNSASVTDFLFTINDTVHFVPLCIMKCPQMNRDLYFICERFMIQCVKSEIWRHCGYKLKFLEFWTFFKTISNFPFTFCIKKISIAWFSWTYFLFVMSMIYYWQPSGASHPIRGLVCEWVTGLFL